MGPEKAASDSLAAMEADMDALQEPEEVWNSGGKGSGIGFQ